MQYVMKTLKISSHHHHHHHLFFKCPFFHATLGFVHMRSLHTSLNTSHSGCKPSTSMSLSTHSFQVFLFLPLHLAPATSTFLQPDTQSSTLLRSTCPNHLNLPRLTTSATLSTPKRLYKSTLHFLSFNDTLHIHLTIICSVLSRLCRFAFFIAQVSVPYVNALWTHSENY